MYVPELTTLPTQSTLKDTCYSTCQENINMSPKPHLLSGLARTRTRTRASPSLSKPRQTSSAPRVYRFAVNVIISMSIIMHRRAQPWHSKGESTRPTTRMTECHRSGGRLTDCSSRQHVTGPCLRFRYAGDHICVIMLLLTTRVAQPRAC
jgi:hypothetical protein